MFLTAKVWNGGKDFSTKLVKVTKTNAYIIYALSYGEDTSKVSLRILIKNLIDELIDHPIDMFF